jgi:hypothetical protein
LNWVGVVSTDYELDDASCGTRTGTCTWIRSRQTFLDWFGPPDVAIGISSPVLWLHGGPGIGKTHLASSIIKYLQEYSSSYPTAFFMSNHSYEEKRQTTSILRSWVYQLMQQSKTALQIAQEAKPENGSAVPTVLWKIFRAILQELGPCYLVIDGYDECWDFDPDSRCSVKGALQSFMKELRTSTESTEAKILIVSRNLDTIRSGLGLYEPIDKSKVHRVIEYPIKKEDTLLDIALVSNYIAESLKIKDDSRRKAVSDQLKEGCDGMFLRLRLVGEQLEPGMLDKDVQDVLNSVPDGLERAYQRNIEAILKTTTKNCQRALDILQILLFATRPLSVMELLCALRMKDVVDQGSKERPDFIQDYEINNLIIQTLIVKPCCSLIEVRGGSGSDPVHFVHFSVKEYLLERMRSEALYPSNPSGRNHDTPYIFGPRNGDDILHEVCLSYVFMRANFEKFGDSSFHEYARSNWAVHFNRLTGDSRSQGLRLQKSLFLGPWFKKWEDKQKRQWDVPNALKDIVDGVTLSPAEMAAMLSLPDLSISLFPDGKTPQRVLAYAAGFGDAATVRTLLQRRKDLDVNWAADGYPWMPLSTACRGGSDSALEALLENEGLNLFGPLNDEGDTALHYTIRQCRNRISDLLLKRGFDVNCKNKGGERPLHIVCYGMLRQWLEPLELLLREDVDLNARDNWGRSVIHKLCSGFIAQLDGLFARDGRTHSGFRPTLRFIAPWKSLTKALELLFLHKRSNVNMNAVDIQGRTPLDYMYLMSYAPSDISSLYLIKVRKALIDHGAIRADQLQIMGMIETASISPAGHGRFLTFIYT